MTVYNVGGRTVNAVNTVNQTLTASSPATFQIELQPSALYEHISGGAPAGSTGKFAGFFNYTNSSDWDDAERAALTDLLEGYIGKRKPPAEPQGEKKE